MGQNEKQLTKAIMKINLINNLITSYEKINELEERDKMKPYTVILDYKDEGSFTKFIVNFQKGKYNVQDIFDMHFSLNDQNKGLELFQKLREKFVKRDSIQYSGFSTEYGKTTDHFIRKNNSVELKTSIHTSKDLETLKNYNNIINNSKVFGYKGFNTGNKTKDELQLIKAKAKANIVCDIINTLSDLNNLEENYNNMKSYNLEINYDLFNDTNDEKYYKYNIQLIKNGLYKNKKLLNLNFSLKNHNIGLRIIQEILRNFSQNNDILLSSFDSNGNSVIQNKSRIKIITNIKTDYDKEKIGSIHEEIKSKQTNSFKVKKIEKK